MPNLKQLFNLKERYGDTNLSSLRKSDIGLIVESFDPDRLEKGFNNFKTKSFSFPEFKVSDYVEYFLERKKANVVLLFIDICSFSQKFSSTSSDLLVEYLDEYYKTVIPIINNNGGEIEKIMGDGIICVFGEPFLDDSKATLHNHANKCAREIISELKDTDFEVKIALHFGEIMYYQNPSDDYFEYTMIGTALTELFRLESVSVGNSINFYCDSYFEILMNQHVLSYQNYWAQFTSSEWKLKDRTKINLAGVNYKYIRQVQLT
jgi:class 3 adenylate cyclase